MKGKFDGIKEHHNATEEEKREDAKKRATQERSQVICPDCGAWLEITSSQPLPDDIKIRLVERRV